MAELTFAKKLGHGTWVGMNYHLAACPLCGEEMSFRFQGGSGIWACWACNKSGDLKQLESDILNSSYGRMRYGEIHFDQPDAPEGLILVSDYKKPPAAKTIHTGFAPIDRMTSGLSVGAMSILTGKTGEGKSTFSGQIALNCINSGHNVCFYSGELSAARFQSWIFTQAAGTSFLNSFVDEFGATRYEIDAWAEPRIRKWLGKKLILYDNSVVKNSERNAILERFALARQYYGCDVFFIDNLMTADFETDNAQNYYIAQGNFIRQINEFALQNDSHVILIAHPKKGDIGDENEKIAGTGDTVKLSTNVIKIKRLSESEQTKFGCNSMASLSKNRDHGTLGDVRLDFDVASRRFSAVGSQNIEHYGWEDEV